MPASSGTMRTYGKRPRVKSSERQTSKRRKLSEDPVIRAPSPRRTENDVDTDTDAESSTPVKPKTYGTPAGTPSKLVRDLSGIFDSMSPSGNRTPMTPTKLARRMLGRSKTESSVESHPPSVKEQQTNGLDRTSSLPNLPSSSSSAHPTPDRLSSDDNIISSLSLSRPTVFPTATSSSKGSTTRTYAGRYRSFLMALPASSSGSTPLSQGLTNEDEFETRESYSSLRSRWGVDNSEDDPHPSYGISSPSNSTTTTSEASPSRNGKGKAAARTVPVPNGMMNPLKSISELRNKGEIRRFLDEVGYLFEGLDPKCGLALRRSSALEITTKLCDPEFTRKAKAADFFGKTWELLLLTGAGKGVDKILDILLVFFLALIARDPVSLAELFERPANDTKPSESHKEGQDPSPVDILIQILETVSSKGDLLALSDQSSRLRGEDVKVPAIPKKDRTILYSIVKVVTSKSNLFPPYTPLSIPLLITLTLHTLPASRLSTSCLPALLNSLRRCLSPHPETDTDTTSSTPTLYTTLSSESRWLDVVKRVPYESVYHHLKLLDAYLVGQWTAGGDPDREKQRVEGHRFLDKARDEWMVGDLLALTVCCELNIREEGNEEEDDPKVDGDNDLLIGAHQKCFTLTFRVLISLTHDNKEWARGVMGCEMTMGLILRTIWKVGRHLLSLARDEGVGEDEEAEEGDGSRMPENERDGGSHAFDTLCLVLGLLTNLVQVVDDAKDVVRRSRLDPSCTLRNRACLKRCACAQKPRKEKERGNRKERRGVEVLVWLYEQLQQQQEGGTQQQRGNFDQLILPQSQDRARAREQENEAQFSLLSGNLSVLFGLLMMGKSGVDNREVIIGSGAADLVPRPSPRPTSQSVPPKRERKGEGQRRRAVDGEGQGNNPLTPKRLKLARLVEQAREFGAFYSVVSRRMTRMSQEGEEQGRGGSKVVQRVVEFLEELRDGVGA